MLFRVTFPVLPGHVLRDACFLPNPELPTATSFGALSLSGVRPRFDSSDGKTGCSGKSSPAGPSVSRCSARRSVEWRSPRGGFCRMVRTPEEWKVGGKASSRTSEGEHFSCNLNLCEANKFQRYSLIRGAVRRACLPDARCGKYAEIWSVMICHDFIL